MPDSVAARSRRLAAAVAITCFVGAAVWAGHAPPERRIDWDYLWFAGRAVVHGANPYQAINQAMAAGRLGYPLYYPATAAVITAPFGVLPLRLAISLWTGLGFGLLAWALSGSGWWRLGALVSGPAIHAMLASQVSPYVVAAVGLPWLGFVWAAKPNIGLALFTAWPSRWPVIGGSLVVLLSFILVPGWPGTWLAHLRDAPHYLAPIQRPGGWLLLLAWLRWRQPEARLLGMLAVIPHTTSLYEMLPLLLIPSTRRQLAVMVGLSWLAFYGIFAHTPFLPADIPAMLAAQWPYIGGLLYLPALLLVLSNPASRPIVGGVQDDADPRDPVPGLDEVRPAVGIVHGFFQRVMHRHAGKETVHLRAGEPEGELRDATGADSEPFRLEREHLAQLASRERVTDPDARHGPPPPASG